VSGGAPPGTQGIRGNPPARNAANAQDERGYIDQFPLVAKREDRIRYRGGAWSIDILENPEKLEVSPLVTTRNYLYQAIEESAIAQGTTAHLEGFGR